MRAVALVALVAVGCGGEKRGERVPATCEGYVAAFRQLAEGPLPGQPDEASLFFEGELPVVAGSRRIPRRHEPEPGDPAIARDPRDVVEYIALAPSDSVRLIKNAASATKRTLRLVVRKPDDELVAQHVRLVPSTPVALRSKLPGLRTIDAAGEEIVRLGASAPCVDFLKAFEIVRDGGMLDELLRAIADALERCRCEVPDPDGLASLLLWIFAMHPDTGYVPVDRDALAKLPDTATVQQAANALAR